MEAQREPHTGSHAASAPRRPVTQLLLGIQYQDLDARSQEVFRMAEALGYRRATYTSSRTLDRPEQ